MISEQTPQDPTAPCKVPPGRGYSTDYVSKVLYCTYVPTVVVPRGTRAIVGAIRVLKICDRGQGRILINYYSTVAETLKFVIDSRGVMKRID